GADWAGAGGSTATAASGELSCAAGGAGSITTGWLAGSFDTSFEVSSNASFGSSTRRGGAAASIASSNGEDSIVPFLSDGNAASGICHWNASSRPDTG